MQSCRSCGHAVSHMVKRCMSFVLRPLPIYNKCIKLYCKKQVLFAVFKQVIQQEKYLLFDVPLIVIIQLDKINLHNEIPLLYFSCMN